MTARVYQWPVSRAERNANREIARYNQKCREHKARACNGGAANATVRLPDSETACQSA